MDCSNQESLFHSLTKAPEFAAAIGDTSLSLSDEEVL
jgi:hypothetical protein